MTYRLLSPAYDTAVAELVRSNLKSHQLDIAGTVYFDDNLYHLSEFYNAMPDKRIYYGSQDDGVGKTNGRTYIRSRIAYQQNIERIC